MVVTVVGVVATRQEGQTGHHLTCASTGQGPVSSGLAEGLLPWKEPRTLGIPKAFPGDPVEHNLYEL